MVNLQITTSTLSKSQLQKIVGSEILLEDISRHEISRGTDPTIVAAAITGGFSVLSSVITLILTHVLAERRERKKQENEPVAVKITVFSDDKLIYKNMDQYATTADFEERELRAIKERIGVAEPEDVLKIDLKLLD